MDPENQQRKEGYRRTPGTANEEQHLEGKEKTSNIDTSTCFPTDETPTPTKILKMADMELFHDLKENPFDVHFRKATEAVKRGADSLSATMTATEIGIQGTVCHSQSIEDTLNTPNIFFSGETTPQPLNSKKAIKSRPVILKVHSSIGNPNIPVASVQPFLSNYKPIAPSPTLLTPSSSSADNALLLLKLPSGETIKLSNLPFEIARANTHLQPHQDVRLRLKNSLSTSMKRNMAETETDMSKIHEDSFNSDPSAENTESSDSADRTELKERNRMSAQRSRQKKRQQIEALARSCKDFQKENSSLKSENKSMKDEIAVLKLELQQKEVSAIRKVYSPCMEKSTETTVSDNNLRPTGLLSQNVILKNPERQLLPHDQIQRGSDFVAVIPSPPQTFPEDLRVNTKYRERREQILTQMHPVSEFTLQPRSGGIILESQRYMPSQEFPPNNNTIQLKAFNVGGSRSSTVNTSTLQKTSKKISHRRSEGIGTKDKKVLGARRLKDKLEAMKQKLAEDEQFNLTLNSYQKTMI